MKKFLILAILSMSIFFIGCGGEDSGTECNAIVNEVTPLTANLDEETTFKVKGTCLPSTLAFWIDNCKDVVKLDSSDIEVSFSCTPTNDKLGEQEGVVKDMPDGKVLKSFNVDIKSDTSCTDTCNDVAYTDPSSAEYNGGGSQVLKLTKVSSDSCNEIKLEITKPDNSDLGAGTYILRVGTCADYGVERGRVTLETSKASHTFTTVYSPEDNDYRIKQFCVTKQDGTADHNEAWWWSNFANVTKVCE